MRYMENYNSRYASDPPHTLIFGKGAVSLPGNDNSRRALVHFTYFRRGAGGGCGGWGGQQQNACQKKTTFPGIPTGAHYALPARLRPRAPGGYGDTGSGSKGTAPAPSVTGGGADRSRGGAAAASEGAHGGPAPPLVLPPASVTFTGSGGGCRPGRRRDVRAGGEDLRGQGASAAHLRSRRRRVAGGGDRGHIGGEAQGELPQTCKAELLTTQFHLCLRSENQKPRLMSQTPPQSPAFWLPRHSYLYLDARFSLLPGPVPSPCRAARCSQPSLLRAWAAPSAPPITNLVLREEHLAPAVERALFNFCNVLGR
jgi:hypothetical protein